MSPEPRYIRFFEAIGAGDVAQVGGKNASLGEMFRALAPHGVLVPNGFAVTAEAYRDTLAQGGALQALEQALGGVDPANVRDLAARAARAREIVAGAPLPRRLAREIRAAHARLAAEYGAGLSVAVRSSATAEDLPGASFAGQHETLLNVRGERRLLAAVRHCFASLFTDRAIRYRIDRGYDHFKVYNPVGVMKMVRSDLAASGVTFTLDTETGFRDVVFITGRWGLGENVVQGNVEPDAFTVFKPTFRMGKRAVLRRTLGAKHLKLVYAGGGRRGATRRLRTPPGERRRYCLDDDEVFALAGQAIAIEEHYGARAGAPRPMDIEWAKDGIDGRLYTVRARPETVVSQRSAAVLERYLLKGAGEARLTGHAVGHRIATGAARVVRDAAELAALRPGEVLVAEMTAPDWGTAMKSAAAIVTDRGGRTCHAAIAARELDIPAVVGTELATRALRSGETVTVSCAEGDIGKVYTARVPYEVERIDLRGLQRPATHIEVNVATPEQAFATSFLPNDGVGLARLETIIAGTIKAHPMALAHPERVADARQRSAIERLAANDATPAAFFVRALAEGVGTIAAAFYPKPVVVRMSDFKAGEYANLLGGRAFETPEQNPVLGFRGAARYTHPAYADGFALECAAMKRVRDDMGLTNVRLMIPFCRRVEEAERVVARMRELGLGRGENGLEIYVMCEVPNNVLQIDAFARHFDGFSIGSNDLTQLALGVDRDSQIVAFDFDERDAGVRELIRLAIVGARRNGRHCGICGQAPSDYPEFAEYLVRLGIDAISLNPDTVLETTQRVLAIERELGRPARQAAPPGPAPASGA